MSTSTTATIENLRSRSCQASCWVSTASTVALGMTFSMACMVIWLANLLWGSIVRKVKLTGWLPGWVLLFGESKTYERQATSAYLNGIGTRSCSQLQSADSNEQEASASEPHS